MKSVILAIIFLLSIPVSLLAATQTGNQNDTTYTVAANGGNPAWTVLLSKNTSLRYFSGPVGVSFVSTVAHTTGDKVYASGASITKLYYYNGTSAPAVTPPASLNTTADFTGWNVL